MGLSHKNFGYCFVIKDFEKFARFLNMYEDLFVPYTEVSINCMTYAHEKEERELMRRGMRTRHGYMVINLYPEDFKMIKESLDLKLVNLNPNRRYSPKGYII